MGENSAVTASERLQQLSGLAGVSAAVMLLAIGTGATTGEALANYSGLATGTASEHLLTDVATQAVGKRFVKHRKVLITINGARFLVPEDQVDKWLEQKEDKVVADLTAPKKVRGKPVAVPVKLDIEKIRAIEAPDYIRDRIAAVNKRIEQRIRIYNESLDEEEELILCLAL